MSDKKERITFRMIEQAIAAHEFSNMLLIGEHPDLVAANEQRIEEFENLRSRLQLGEVIMM